MKTILLAIFVILISSPAIDVEANNEITNPPALGLPIGDKDQDKLVEQLLTDSGMKKSLQRLPEQIISGFKQGLLKRGVEGSGSATDAQNEMMKIFTEAFPKDGFINRVRNSLKKNYDQERYTRLLQLLSTDLLKRMTDIESVEPSPVDVQNFFSQIASRPLSPDRIQLIREMDSATQTSTFLTNITISTIESNAMAVTDNCNGEAAKIKKMIAEKRPEIEKATRSTAQVMLALTYRNVSDADLSEYLKTYEDKDSKWFQDFVRAAIDEQFTWGIGKEAQGIKQFVQAHKPKQTMFAPKCGGQEPTKDDVTLKQPLHKTHDSKSGMDLRECLLFEDPAKVIACTEKFNSKKR